MVVVLPAPFGPRMAVTCARPAVSDSPSTAGVPAYLLTRPWISTAGALLTLASLGSRGDGRVGRAGAECPPRPGLPRRDGVASCAGDSFPGGPDPAAGRPR